jgi:hypothetical protein
LRLQCLALEAALTLFVVRALLRVVSFERWRKRLMKRRVEPAKDGALPGADDRDTSIEPVVAEIVWAVDRVSRRMPEQLACLPRGLAVCEMMRRRGIAATLEIGVTRDERNRFMAHAWVVHRGTVIIGAVPNLERYAKLSGWPAMARNRTAGVRENSGEFGKKE